MALTVVAAAGAVPAAFANTPPIEATTEVAQPTPVKQHPGARLKEHRAKKQAELAEQLGLTEAQQAEIKSIITSARQANVPLREKLAENRKKVRQLTNAIPLDEAALRTLIANNEAVRTELAVSRIKVHSQVQAVFTPDQREKAKKLRLFSPEGLPGGERPEF
jgi:Spy/CpxP family protein refolding chaperone